MMDHVGTVAPSPATKTMRYTICGTGSSAADLRIESQTYVCYRHRRNKRRYQIDHHDETHGETAETAQFIKEDKFAKVVHGRVDPTPPLGQQNLPVVGSHRICMSVANELRLEIREVLKKKCGEVSIFSEVQQVLHVQCVHTILRVVLDQLVGDEERFVRIRSPQAVERETTGQTCHRTEETLECLGHVVGDEVLVDLE